MTTKEQSRKECKRTARKDAMAKGKTIPANCQAGDCFVPAMTNDASFLIIINDRTYRSTTTSAMECTTMVHQMK